MTKEKHPEIDLQPVGPHETSALGSSLKKAPTFTDIETKSSDQAVKPSTFTDIGPDDSTLDDFLGASPAYVVTEPEETDASPKQEAVSRATRSTAVFNGIDRFSPLPGCRPPGPRGLPLLAGYTLVHFLVDAFCFFFLFSDFALGAHGLMDFASGLLLYNLFAFGLQFIWGLIADRFPRLPLGVFGMVLVGASFVPSLMALLSHGGALSPGTQPPAGLIPGAPGIAGPATTGAASAPSLALLYLIIIVMGIGNAAFHVEGGRDSLANSARQEARTGVFSAGGAAGVIAGTMLATFKGPTADYIRWGIWLLAIFGLILLKRYGLSLIPPRPSFKVKRPASFERSPRELGGLRYPRSNVPSTTASVAAFLFILVQTYALPKPDSLKLLPDFALTGAPVLWIAPLIAALVLGRAVGGWVTRTIGVLPTYLFAAAAIVAQTILSTPATLVASAFFLSLPGARAAYRFYVQFPYRPAFAYALQKIPMFIGVALLIYHPIILSETGSGLLGYLPMVFTAFALICIITLAIIAGIHSWNFRKKGAD